MMPASGAGGRRFKSDQPHVNLYILFSPISRICVVVKSNSINREYGRCYKSILYMFKYTIRSDLTRKYYERRIRTFFDFIEFLVSSDIEKRCNFFAHKAKIDNNWASIQIIKFLQYEKLRVEKSEITAATLSNFVKSIKLFCEMCEMIQK
jgi:hypothetical protein